MAGRCPTAAVARRPLVRKKKGSEKPVFVSVTRSPGVRTLKPRNQGCSGSSGWPASARRTFSTTSRGLNGGTSVDQPVPMPSEPLRSTNGTIGTYWTGSTNCVKGGKRR